MATIAIGERSGDLSRNKSNPSLLPFVCLSPLLVLLVVLFFFRPCTTTDNSDRSLAANRRSFAPLASVSIHASKPGAARASDVMPMDIPSIRLRRNRDEATARASFSAILTSLLC